MHTQRYGFWGYLILIIGLAGICALLIIINQDVLIKSGVSARLIWGIWAGLFSLFLLGVVCSPFWWIRKQRKAQFIYRPKNSAENDQPVSSPSEDILTDLSSNIRLRYGPFWRRKVRLLLVTGEPEEAEAIAPGLTGQHWLEGDAHRQGLELICKQFEEVLTKLNVAEIPALGEKFDPEKHNAVMHT